MRESSAGAAAKPHYEDGMNERESRNRDTTLRYVQALSDAATGDALAQFLHPQIVFEVYPNLLRPNGARTDLAGMKAASDVGARTVRAQRYDVRNVVAEGDTVVLEVDWSCELAAPMGHLAEGHVLRAHFATFLSFRDGLIVAQRQYDCFEPF
jgi:ketosteroid isomerase-like protein